MSAVQISELSLHCPRRTGHLEVEINEGHIQITTNLHVMGMYNRVRCWESSRAQKGNE